MPSNLLPQGVLTAVPVMLLHGLRQLPSSAHHPGHLEEEAGGNPHETVGSMSPLVSLGETLANLPMSK